MFKVVNLKPLSEVKIVSCTLSESIGFTGTLYTNLRSFHANAGIFSMSEILAIPEQETCIGILGNSGSFWWTKDSDFDVEIVGV